MLPAPARARLAAGDPHVARSLVAAAFGDPKAWWGRTRLSLFDPAGLVEVPEPGLSPLATFAAVHGGRRDAGAFYTPVDVADALVAQLPTGSLLDPSTGGGVFLDAALRAADDPRALAEDGLYALDVDPFAVEVARAVVVARSGADPRKVERGIVVGDARSVPLPRMRRALTNPPFLTPLRGRGGAGGDEGVYADASVRITLRMLEAAEDVGVILPASIVATRDARLLRETLDRRGVAGVWSLPEGLFDGVAIPTLALWTGAGGIERWSGLPPVAAEPVAPDTPWPGRRVREGLPTLRYASRGVLGDVAHATADFRDEFYAVRGHVTEGGPGLRVHTSGLIALGRSDWGVRPARIHGQAWTHPTVAPEHLHPRQRAQQAPKLLVATQTRVLEAVADPDGTCLALTPVLHVYPRGWALPRLLAVLVSPVATLWALHHYGGAGLSADAVKLSAAQLRTLPLPAGDLDGVEPLVEAGDWLAVARHVTRAYRAPEGVVDWWAARR